MASDAQISANRENGKLGGVKTEEGKAVSRFNARKHGICGQLVSEYEDDIYDHYFDQLFTEYDPKGWKEVILVERIATCYLQLYRAAKAEREFMRTLLEPTSLESVTRSLTHSFPVRISSAGITTLGSVYLRYTTTNENRMDRAMRELERIQAVRKAHDAGGVAPIV